MARRPFDLRARVRAWPRRHVDALLAAGVVGATAIEVGLADTTPAGRAGALAVATLIAAAILLRRAAPLGSIVPAAVAMALVAAVPETATDNLGAAYFGWLFVVYSLGMHASGPRLAAGAVVAFAAVLVGGLGTQGVTPDDLLFGLLISVATPLAAGQLLAGRLRMNQVLRERAERLEHERAGAAAEAVSEERARIAGEVHDLVAHALGAMTIQAAAARRLATTDGERAGSAFVAIETTGREALSELRGLLEMLRDDNAGTELRPQPGLDHLEDLVRRTRDAGLPVQLEVDGRPDGTLPPGVDLTAYRVVQEALGEAHDGGAGRAIVRVRFADGAVEIDVLDDGMDTRARRLLGLRERVRVYGGQVDAGPRRQGGHEVRARLPLETAA